MPPAALLLKVGRMGGRKVREGQGIFGRQRIGRFRKPRKPYT
jgi:hypothetical protein